MLTWYSLFNKHRRASQVCNLTLRGNHSAFIIISVCEQCLYKVHAPLYQKVYKFRCQNYIYLFNALVHQCNKLISPNVPRRYILKRKLLLDFCLPFIFTVFVLMIIYASARCNCTVMWLDSLRVILLDGFSLREIPADRTRPVGRPYDTWLRQMDRHFAGGGGWAVWRPGGWPSGDRRSTARR